MSDKLKLSILSPERRLVEALEVDEVTLTGSEGQIQLLPGHAAMVGTIETGLFEFRSGDQPPVTGVISTGFFEVRNNVVQVLGEILELKGEIDLGRAKKAQQLAEETLKDAELDEHKFKKYQLKLQRALVRQQVVGHS